MICRTPLYQTHLAENGKVVEFGGWDMPVHYGSQIDEHHVVRKDAGMFDVSHMTVIDLSGPDVSTYLLYLLANDIGKLTSLGKALYSCMLNEQGGVIDDLIAYKIDTNCYRLVVNASTREKDLQWIRDSASGYQVEIVERSDLAIIAVQGPKAPQKVASILAPSSAQQLADIKPFFGATIGNCFYGRTGYTGEDGFEIMVPDSQVVELWEQLREAGVAPCGLGARDTLRLEAGMNLYGQDMDESISPFEAGLTWTVAMTADKRKFIGREALEREQLAGAQYKFVGLILQSRGVLRSHQQVVVDGVGEGEVTSGTFSPTMRQSIGLARVPQGTQGSCQVVIRGKSHEALVVRPPFVRHGKILVNG